jgi:hypothetical protein
MSGLLNDRGFQVEHVQVSCDYKLLNMKTDRVRQREAQAAQEQPADLFTPGCL